MIPSGITFLSGAWIFSHLLILGAINNCNYRRIVLILSAVLLVTVYLIKPYTYDLEKYSIYFVTGYIPTTDWHTPDDGFQLDARDTTGDPYTVYELGFRWLSKVGNFVLPSGSLIPRYDQTFWDFEERGPPRHDAILFLIIISGAASLIFSTRALLRKMASSRVAKPDDLGLMLVVIMGSVFFFIGTQNVLRQFLGLVIVLMALNCAVSKKYAASVLLVILASIFHRWMIGFGVAAIIVVEGLSWSQNRWPLVEVRLSRITRFEFLSLVAGLTVVIVIKGFLVFGVFHMDIPLIGDLKAYVLNQGQYQMFERLDSWIKLGAIVFLFGLSEVVQGVTIISKPLDPRLLRRSILFFILPLLIYPEIFARVLLYYWLVEMIFVAWALQSNERRTQLAGAMVFLAYGIAPNALNILLGPEWLQFYHEG